MSQVFKRTKGHQPILRAVVNQDGTVLALLLPVQITLFPGILWRLTTRSIAYGSILCDSSSVGEEALELLLRSYTQEASHVGLFTELRNLSDLSAFQPILEQFGFLYEDHLDYLIDLNCSPEQLLMNIGARTRKHIRQGLRKGNVIVEQITDSKLISSWYKLVSKTYKAVRVPLADLSLFESAFDILYPRNMISFWLARIGSTYVAASAELLYKDLIYGWYGGMDREYASELPGELLMWHILEWGATSGYKTYDFGGAGKPGESYGVRDFKAKFGGQLVSFGRNLWVPHPWILSLSERVYALYRYLGQRNDNSQRKTDR